MTSRAQFTDLVADHGAQPITRDMLSLQEARESLLRLLGAGRVAAEEEATPSSSSGAGTHRPSSENGPMTDGSSWHLDAVPRTAPLLRKAPDPQAAVPGLDRNVGESGAHMVGELRQYTNLLRGEADPGGHPEPADGGPGELNGSSDARLLEEFTDRDTDRDTGMLAGMMEPAARDFVRGGRGPQVGEGFRATNGLPMTVPVMTATLFGEQAVHRSGHRPRLRRALAVIEGIMPGYVDRARAGAGTGPAPLVRAVLPRRPARYWLRIDDGTAAVTTRRSETGPGCRITADPVAFMVVGYCRTGQVGQALRGGSSPGAQALAGPEFGTLLTPI